MINSILMNTSLTINWEQLSLVVGDDANPGDEEMKDLYRLFTDDAGRRLLALTAPAAPLEPLSIAKEAHKIRGAASSFGFDQVAMLLRTVETQINELSSERVAELLNEARQTFDSSVHEVAERYPGLSA